ncbi:hypothetical protein PAHAL_8G221400 [Panicum hallii]|uniref:KIB1-4 beta-propeller domain-containing protein n=1 Tax=Panicum hallii TaxID=206008 RepID=A0A2T8I9W0_9POAL|nr:hypothetical protein PAHAL_8G221400 [Panicum hallii]
MEQATEGGSGSGVIAGRDWSGLSEELLVSFLLALDVPGAVRSGAVCTTWNAAYAAFRRLRAPSPRQPPCLLYASGALAPGAAALHCPATGATLQIPFPRAPLALRPLLGSGHGWLVIADEASNLHLLNPITGAQAALPPVTGLHNVMMGTDKQGGPAYAVYSKPGYEPVMLEIDLAHEYMYNRVVLSASPSAGRACVVLLLHMPMGEVSFARLGDDRWTWVASGEGTGLPWRCDYEDAMYSDVDGLFYLVRTDASMVSLDLNGSSPVARKILHVLKSSSPSKYLVQTPAGDILQVWRLKDYVDPQTPVNIPPDYDGLNPYKVDLHGQRLELLQGLPDYALFLGSNASMCLPVKDFHGLKPNCAYVSDDCLEYVHFCKYNRREIGIWSMAEQSMSKLDDVSPVLYRWLYWPSPIWIKPSFL